MPEDPGPFTSLDDLANRTDCVVDTKLRDQDDFGPEMAFFRDGRMLVLSPLTDGGVISPANTLQFTMGRMLAEMQGAEHFSMFLLLKIAGLEEESFRVVSTVAGDRDGNRIINFRPLDGGEDCPLRGRYEFNVNTSRRIQTESGGVITYASEMDPWLQEQPCSVH